MTSKQPDSKQDSIDEILDHTVYKEGTGANGSGGEWEYWKDGKRTTLKARLQSLIQEAVIKELESLLVYNGAYIGIDGRRVDDMLSHSYIKARIKSIKAQKEGR